MDTKYGMLFANKSGRFVKTLSKYASPLGGKSTRDVDLVDCPLSGLSIAKNPPVGLVYQDLLLRLGA